MKFGYVPLLMALCGPVAMANGGDAAAGKVKAAMCMACHGNNGNSTNPMYPVLAGKDGKYLFERLQAYKKGQVKTDNAAMMNPLAANLSEQDMRDLAAYFSSQTPAAPAEKRRRR